MPGLLDPNDPNYARPTPVVGSRSPLPSSGAGPMSNAAILSMLQQRQQQLAQQQAQQAALAQSQGVGSLPANYLTNPKAVIEAQLRAIQGN